MKNRSITDSFARQLGEQHLDRHPPRDALVLRQEHLPHPPLPQQPEHRVTADAAANRDHKEQSSTAHAGPRARRRGSTSARVLGHHGPMSGSRHISGSSILALALVVGACSSSPTVETPSGSGGTGSGGAVGSGGAGTGGAGSGGSIGAGGAADRRGGDRRRDRRRGRGDRRRDRRGRRRRRDFGRQRRVRDQRAQPVLDRGCRALRELRERSRHHPVDDDQERRRTAVVDDVHAARGTKALHVKSTAGSANFAYIKETPAFPATNNLLYGRMFVWFEDAHHDRRPLLAGRGGRHRHDRGDPLRRTVQGVRRRHRPRRAPATGPTRHGEDGPDPDLDLRRVRVRGPTQRVPRLVGRRRRGRC